MKSEEGAERCRVVSREGEGGRGVEKEKEDGREESCISWFISQKAALARSGPG